MVRLTATEAREHFADTLNRVSYRGERILEDRFDHEAIQKALAEPGKRVSYRTFRKTLGL